MLSYQHAYHAGNLADVHKHAALAWMLGYMTRKPKPLSYIESHAGRALYRLDAAEAAKTGEAAQGILKVADWFEADHPYARILAETRAEHGPLAYPGSPEIAARSLRADDRMHLAELHPQEHAALQAGMGQRAKVHRRDGIEMAIAQTPPEPRRGLLLIDPSWEIKDEYRAIPQAVRRIAKRWPVGCIVLWYPILRDAPHAAMLRALERDLPEGVRHEVTFPPARAGHGMTGSGLFVVNPPYGFHAQAQWLSTRFATLAPQG
ncbi:23S rRNA (adenine(2030)-N(6))-methyltransferase RlmJ [Limimaricola hongkongensis]|uniref:Ribosomal RNA large subunit methyltransferase J n=1 Tax=Limimaricola hongkongensis DSM 17492 TaxID=1122180 RepID=A0A017HG04_9RHOB|nr:23S rRNA (adenine(2030)-N(6))-methyltransferase RlmJ [Limimaricola hongkongensis]EYD72724.1 Protein involved in catabolism of external DNA [Limimaricola hongkongensis DSM 17492]